MNRPTTNNGFVVDDRTPHPVSHDQTQPITVESHRSWPRFLAYLVAGLVAAGGTGFGASQLNAHRAERNEGDIGEQSKSIESATVERAQLRERVSQHDRMLKRVGEDVKKIRSGIESLKQENVSRLERELREARRELRRRER